MMSAPTITFTGVFGLDALSLYNTEKRFSSIAGNILSAKIFAQDFSSGFFLRIFPVLSVLWQLIRKNYL